MSDETEVWGYFIGNGDNDALRYLDGVYIGDGIQGFEIDQIVRNRGVPDRNGDGYSDFSDLSRLDQAGVKHDVGSRDEFGQPKSLPGQIENDLDLAGDAFDASFADPGNAAMGLAVAGFGLARAGARALELGFETVVDWLGGAAGALARFAQDFWRDVTGKEVRKADDSFYDPSGPDTVPIDTGDAAGSGEFVASSDMHTIDTGQGVTLSFIHKEARGLELTGTSGNDTFVFSEFDDLSTVQGGDGHDTLFVLIDRNWADFDVQRLQGGDFLVLRDTVSGQSILVGRDVEAVEVGSEVHQLGGFWA